MNKIKIMCLLTIIFTIEVLQEKGNIFNKNNKILNYHTKMIINANIVKDVKKGLQVK